MIEGDTVRVRPRQPESALVLRGRTVGTLQGDGKNARQIEIGNGQAELTREHINTKHGCGPSIDLPEPSPRRTAEFLLLENHPLFWCRGDQPLASQWQARGSRPTDGTHSGSLWSA